MSPITKALIKEILAQFAVEGTYVSALPFGNGHINDTFLVTFEQEESALNMSGSYQYILQRINTDAFKEPAKLMENIINVTEFLRDKAMDNHLDRLPIYFLRTNEGLPYYLSPEKDYWRLQTFSTNTISLDQIDRPRDFYESARAFGDFQKQLADFDAHILHETIPHFHDTKIRYENFCQAVDQDLASRVNHAKREIAFVHARKDKMDMLTKQVAEGLLPLRVTHNDTKLNNVLFDKDTKEAVEVIDLDTVMPGLVAYDFGDSIRYGANTALEDETDLDKVSLSLELFTAFSQGFLEEVHPIITKEEVDSLSWGAYLMTLECGIRFLTDYLEGDHYFKTVYPNHNLDRARNQFKLIESMENHWDDMHNIVEEIYRKLTK